MEKDFVINQILISTGVFIILTVLLMFLGWYYKKNLFHCKNQLSNCQNRSI